VNRSLQCLVGRGGTTTDKAGEAAEALKDPVAKGPEQ
jgi:hypothetical protein